MSIEERPPGGPRGSIGAAAEDAAARHLAHLGWAVVARNLRLDRDEIDIVATEPGASPVLVCVEVRSRSSPGFGSPAEGVSARKVARLYRSALMLRSTLVLHRDSLDGILRAVPLTPSWRVDLLTLRKDAAAGWVVESHLRGLAPP